MTYVLSAVLFLFLLLGQFCSPTRSVSGGGDVASSVANSYETLLPLPFWLVFYGISGGKK